MKANPAAVTVDAPARAAQKASSFMSIPSNTLLAVTNSTPIAKKKANMATRPVRVSNLQQKLLLATKNTSDVMLSPFTKCSYPLTQ
jgi:hypothetical protein